MADPDAAARFMKGFIEYLHELWWTEMRNNIVTFAKLHHIMCSLAFTLMRIFFSWCYLLASSTNPFFFLAEASSSPCHPGLETRAQLKQVKTLDALQNMYKVFEDLPVVPGHSASKTFLGRLQSEDTSPSKPRERPPWLTHPPDRSIKPIMPQRF